MAQVSLRKIIKAYEGGVQAVKGIDLEIEDHEFVVLVGPSGCGKSTTLRMIAGLEEITGGEIAIGGTVVNDIPPRDRDIAMVFQNYALYPHMSVYDNMAFGLTLRKFPKAEIDKRAIVRDPKVFLFDEPLSNLDAKLRVQMRTEIKKVHQTVKTTTVYVTHDQVEAMTLADRVVVMNHGIIEQVGPPQVLYHTPATRFVAGFIGSPAMNFIPATLEEMSGALRLNLPGGMSVDVPEARTDRYRPYAGKQVIFGIRPEHLTDDKPTDKTNPAPMMLTPEVIEPMGMETLAHFKLEGAELTARLDPATPAEVGQPLRLIAHMDQMHLIDPTTDKVI
jgi:multiple sugar transport system ATP-binding protein